MRFFLPEPAQTDALALFLRQPEVDDGDFEAALGPTDADVVALDVVVHQITRVDVHEGFHNLDGDLDPLLGEHHDGGVVPVAQDRAAVMGDHQRLLGAHTHEPLDARDFLERGQGDSFGDRGNIRFETGREFHNQVRLEVDVRLSMRALAQQTCLAAEHGFRFLNRQNGDLRFFQNLLQGLELLRRRRPAFSRGRNRWGHRGFGFLVVMPHALLLLRLRVGPGFLAGGPPALLLRRWHFGLLAPVPMKGPLRHALLLSPAHDRYGDIALDFLQDLKIGTCLWEVPLKGLGLG